ncbi:MAG: ribosome-associated translation inhibitor RaiA [Clostridiales Family XIII bacterium]|jgi:putative sigma-54 modulation protein|nr:ribosome-associated translation inhibitor RaiA [Clostridiales Family XIII bacterium]
MKINISAKNYNPSQRLQDMIEKKFTKLGKYFTSDIETAITIAQEKDRQKIEATINADGAIFRAEEVGLDVYVGLDKVVDKLASQMSKYKQKIANHHKGNRSILFADIPDATESAKESFEIVRRKTYELMPMTPEEAILQMELVSHAFYLFHDMETNSIAAVYKRNDGKYGLLETTL